MRFRWIYILLLAVIALCLLPVYSVWWSSSFAEKHGCTLHEGFVNPCIVDGIDRGPDLYTAFVSGWFMLATLPIAALCVLIILIISLRDMLHRRKHP